MINPAEFTIKLSKRQTIAWDCTEPELGIGGAGGGGKSVFLVAKAFTNACTYPGSRSFLGRKVFEDLKISTLQTWREKIPYNSYTENKQDKVFTIKVGNVNSTILYGGFNDSETRDKFKSAEFSFAYIDQSEELTEQDYLDVMGRLRQRLPDGSRAPRQGIFSSNPKKCYFRNKFIISPTRVIHNFVQFLPKDNPYLDPTYLDYLKELYKNRPEMYDALVNGNWDIAEDVNVVIKLSWAERCSRVKDVMRFQNKIGVSCDAAMFGDDETVIYGWQGTRQIDRDVFGKQDPDFVASRCLAMLKKIQGNWIALGGGAIGEMVANQLKKIVDDDVEIIMVGEAMEADDNKKFYNRRAEMYWETGELMSEGAVSLIPDPVLNGQLSFHTYKFLGGRILINKKELIKKDAGRSPDFADATAIGIWGLKRAPELPTRSRISRSSTSKWIEKAQLEANGVLSVPYDLQSDVDKGE